MANTTVELQKSTVYTGPDPVSSAMIADVERVTKLYTELSTELAAATGDRAKAVESWIQSSTDDKAVKLRALIAKANAELNELAEKSVTTVSLSEEDVAKKREELKTLKTLVRDKRSAAALVASTTGIDTENALKALESIEDPTKGKGGVKTGTAGPKGPRVSATVKVTGFGVGNDEVQTFDGLSKAAQAIGLETKDIQEAYAKAASVPFENIAKVSKPLSFDVTAAGGKVFKFETTPKPRANAVKATEKVVTEAPASENEAA
jgi:hypothetical protein